MVGLPNIESIDKDEAEKDKQSVPAASTDAMHFLKGLTTDIIDVKALVPEPEEKTPELKKKIWNESSCLVMSI